MNLDTIIRDVQRKLGVTVDGKPGPETWAAIHDRIVGPSPDPAPNPAVASERSERVIATLHPRVQPYARALWHAAQDHGIHLEIISGTRTYAEQDDLYAQGRTKPGRIVTNARSGYSNHNFGIAFDVGVFSGGLYLDESPAYKAVGALGEKLGLDWGGDWHSFQDEPHFELRPDWAKTLTEPAMLEQLRERVALGKDVFE